MKKVLNKIIAWVHLIGIRLGVAMRDADEEIFKADPNLSEKKRHEQRQLARNPLHRKMEQGKKDERYAREFYELLRKADEFMKKSTPAQMEKAAQKWGMTIGMTDAEIKDRARVGKKAFTGESNVKFNKDKWGKRYDHFGFFDPKSKHAGKTLGEVIQQEIKQRKTKDDDYPIEIMFSNIPTTKGLLEDDEFFDYEKGQALNELEKAMRKKFPLKVGREGDKEPVNKIERLTEYLHIKKVSEEYRILEFFIPAKYGVGKLKEDDPIFKEIIDIKYVWVNDNYDKKFGYNVYEYYKMVDVVNEKLDPDHKDYILYNVIKLNAKIIENIDLNI